MKKPKLLLLILFAMVVTFGLAGESVADLFHGLTTQKGTNPSTLAIGQNYHTTFRIKNDADDSNDTVVVTSLIDVIHSAGGYVSSGEIIGKVIWTFSGGADQNSVTGAITLPPGASVSNLANPYDSNYPVTQADYDMNSTTHKLSDIVTIIHHDKCDCACCVDTCPGCVWDCPACSQDNVTDTRVATVTIVPKPCIEVDKSVECDTTMPGETLIYTIKITNCSLPSIGSLSRVSVIDTLLGNLDSEADAAGCGNLDPNDWCTFDVNYTVPDPCTATTINNTVAVAYKDSLDQEATGDDLVIVNLVHPDFTVIKSCQNEPVPPGGSAIFDIVITNIGDVALNFTTNEPCLPGPFTLAPDANMAVTVSRAFDGNDVFNQVIVEANLPDALCYQLPANIVKEANDTCAGEVTGATRTPGFWKTHCVYTEHVLDVHCGGSINLGWVNLTDINDVLGVLRQ